jgi:FtsZ-binding cell division protein ZapB
VETQTTQIITKTVKSIDNLKEKNTDLKYELIDANKKIDTITNVNVGVKFNLLPISDIKENR